MNDEHNGIIQNGDMYLQISVATNFKKITHIIVLFPCLDKLVFSSVYLSKLILHITYNLINAYHVVSGRFRL